MPQRTRRAGAKGGFRYQPQLATLVAAPPSGAGWVHELKYDGYRIGASLKGDRIVLESRNGKDWTSAFPELVEALKRLQLPEALLDGEAAIVDAQGRTDFQALQNSFAGGKRQGVTYFAFDLLQLEGEDLTDLPLEERKARLRQLIPSEGPVRYSEHLEGDGATILAAACKLGAEGIVSKRRDRPHRSGRHDDWRKSKCSRRLCSRGLRQCISQVDDVTTPRRYICVLWAGTPIRGPKRWPAHGIRKVRARGW